MIVIGNSNEDLQMSLDKLYEYCSMWGLEVNTAKTKIVVFRKRGRVYENETWVYDNQVIVDAPPEELRQHAHDRKQQANACRYAQHVIRKNDFNNEDLPW